MVTQSRLLLKPTTSRSSWGVVIFHLDLDSFFVSAERLRNPRLRHRCMAVGGTKGRGVISSASYEARKFGVRSAMPVQRALRLCPQLILVPPDFELYSSLSKQVFQILERYTPQFEAVSIDEGYLDMRGTESLWGPPRVAAEKIRAEIFAKTGLTCSIGIAANRRVAKIASDSCKPNGVRWIEAGKEAEFLAPLPIRNLPGIGPATEQALNARGIFTLGDLQKRPHEELHSAAMGQGSTEFFRKPIAPSISRERTFEKNTWDPEVIEKTLWQLVAELGQDLRENRRHTQVVRLKLRYPPFETLTRAKTFEVPTQSDAVLFETLRTLLHAHWDNSRPLRLLGVGCSPSSESPQLGLFDDLSEIKRREKIDHLKDALTQRFGEKALKTGRDLE